MVRDFDRLPNCEALLLLKAALALLSSCSCCIWSDARAVDACRLLRPDWYLTLTTLPDNFLFWGAAVGVFDIFLARDLLREEGLLLFSPADFLGCLAVVWVSFSLS